MSGRHLAQRIATIEASTGSRTGVWHRFIVPDALTPSEREAWQAARLAELPPGDHALFRVIVDPPPRAGGSR